MKDNTLEHLFDFAPNYGTVKLAENKFLKTKKYKTMMNWLLLVSWNQDRKCIDFQFYINFST